MQGLSCTTKSSVETLQQQKSAHDVPPVGMQRLQQKNQTERPNAAQFLWRSCVNCLVLLVFTCNTGNTHCVPFTARQVQQNASHSSSFQLFVCQLINAETPELQRFIPQKKKKRFGADASFSHFSLDLLLFVFRLICRFENWSYQRLKIKKGLFMSEMAQTVWTAPSAGSSCKCANIKPCLLFVLGVKSAHYCGRCKPNPPINQVLFLKQQQGQRLINIPLNKRTIFYRAHEK